MQPVAASSPSAKKSPLYKALYFQVLVGLVLGITVGHFWPDFGASLKVLGDGFVKLVKMMIGPIVFCTIVSGITSLSDSKEIGRTLVKSMALFYALTILALITGLVAVTVMQPGVGMNIDPTHLDKAVAASYAKQAAPKGFVEFVLHIIPNAFFGAFAEGEVLPVLLIAIICGFGLTKIGAAGKPVLEGINSFAHMLEPARRRPAKRALNARAFARCGGTGYIHLANCSRETHVERRPFDQDLHTVPRRNSAADKDRG